MSRLPNPGGDDGTWGNILNDFLKVSHNDDGSIKASAISSKADDSATVHKTGDETVAGTKTFSANPVVPTPTDPTHAVTKAYADGLAVGGAPDAAAGTKGILRLTGDLAGTADSPQIATGVIVDADINPSAAIAQSKVANLTTDLASKVDDSQLDADNTLAADSDARVATQKATKAYVDAQVSGGGTPDATASTKGKLKLTGDLGGTADSPTVPGLTGKVDKSTATTKGDLLTATGAGAITRLGVGSDNQVLVADSAQATGLKWTTPAGGGDTSSNTATSVDGEVALFSGTSGKTIKRATGSGIAKLNSGVLTTATSGTDYAPATSGSAILKGNGSGGFSNASAGTDYVTPAGTETLTNKTLTSPVINTPTGITKSDVGLGNVNNTSDANKPVSTAVQTALDLKLDDSQLDIDGTLAANSDTAIASQKATKTYADTKIAKNTATTKGDILTATGSAAITRLGVGNAADTLQADDSTATGLRWAPAQFNVSKATVGGSSYVDQTAGTSETQAWGTQYNVDQSLMKRISTMLGVNESQINNFGVASAKLLQASSAGGWVTGLRAMNPYKTRKPYTSPNGICISVYGINDVNTYGSSTQYKTAYCHALRTLISRYRASSVFENDDSSVTYGGSGGSHWSNTASTTINSGSNYATTSTTNDTFTIAVPSSFEGGTIALGFIGASGTTGGTVSVTVDASSAGSFSTSNITADGNRTGMVMRLTGLAAGSHTIVGTVSSLDGGGSVQFDYWQIESPYPNPVVVCNIAKLNSYGGSATDNIIDDWNTSIAAVVAEFENPIALANIAELLKPAGRLAADTIHPSETGAMYIAEEIRKAFVRSGGTLHDFSTPSSFNATSAMPVSPIAPVTATTWIAQTGLQAGTATALTQDKCYFVPIEIPGPCVLDKINLLNVTVGGSAGSVLRMGIYWDYRGRPRNVLVDAGTIASTATGVKTITFSTAVKIQVPGQYWLAIAPQVASGPTVTTLAGHDPRITAAQLTGILRPACATLTGVTGAFADITGTNGRSAVSPELYVNVSSTTI